MRDRIHESLDPGWTCSACGEVTQDRGPVCKRCKAASKLEREEQRTAGRSIRLPGLGAPLTPVQVRILYRASTTTKIHTGFHVNRLGCGERIHPSAVKALEVRGLVTTSRDGDGVVWVTITDAGRAVAPNAPPER